MTTSTTHRIILGLLLLLPLSASAAFITDRILVEVRSERFGQGTVLKKIPSGTSVEILMTDGQYTRVRTPDNVTGWVASTFLTKKKPTQLEYLELLSKTKTLETKLREAEARLATNQGANTPGISAEEMEKLKQEAKNARWMKVEMQKARDRAQQAEAKLKSYMDKQTQKGAETKNVQQQLQQLRAENKELEKRLAAALLVNEQQTEQQAEPQQTIPIIATNPHANESIWQVGLEWLLVISVLALFAGIVIGITWLDRRIRQRHGGFRIY